MLLLQNISIKERHTFHIQAKTRYWAEFSNLDDLKDIFTDKRFYGLPCLSIGSGSNLLFSCDYPGLLLHSAIKSFEILSENNDQVLVRTGSGIVWDDFVAEVVKNGWSGAENLSGIPGEVGAVPVQNIGAYGTEARKVIFSVEAFNREKLKMETFSFDDCRFGYRDSIFKHELKNKYVVCYVIFRLSKYFVPDLSYGDIAARVKAKGEISVGNLRKTILEIRSEKLPDPEVTGNAGSFFMNPVITSEQYKELKSTYPDIKGWIQDSANVKISAAWCIEKAGWKGGSIGNAGVHESQALVLINKGNATSSEIIRLSEKIMDDVKKIFNISLHPEVMII
jgi:UDP-N-acetylmuramate dehydrogenase